MNTPTLDFFYFRPKRRLQASIAYIFDRETGKVTWGASFAHTKLDQFKRKEGRARACVNLSTYPRALVVDKNAKREVIHEAIIPALRQYRRELGEIANTNDQEVTNGNQNP